MARGTTVPPTTAEVRNVHSPRAVGAPDSQGLSVAVPGLAELHATSRGDAEIRIAILDGPLDRTHPCFSGANIREVATMVPAVPGTGRMSRHGTHVASVLLGQPGTAVSGVAPGCTGLSIPIFSESEGDYLPQLDLARALEAALREGAHVVNISGGERSGSGQPDPILERVLRTCEEQNVLVVAAGGNDGCDCLHVPAAFPTVLAVGALGRDGTPMPITNWGAGYQSHGVLALGESIEGAEPGGGTRRMSGTSFATPVVAGIAALLLSVQRASSGAIDPAAVGRAIVETATPWTPECSTGDSRCVAANHLDVRAAYGRVLAALERDDRPRILTAGFDAPVRQFGEPTASDGVRAAGLEPYETDGVATPEPQDIFTETSPKSGEPNHGGDTTVQESVGTLESPAAVADVTAIPAENGAHPIGTGAPSTLTARAGVTAACADENPRTLKPAGGCGCGCRGVKASEGDETAEATAAKTLAAATAVAAVTPSNVYAVGAVGFDFGTEARRDTFRQLMPDVVHEEDGTPVSISPNPYDVFQLTDYLNGRPSESTKLIWTLNLDLTPIYALEAEVAYPDDVYSTLRDALARHALPEDDPGHVAKVSIPGVLTNRSVRLFSGQLLPVVVVQARGLYEWNVPALVNQVIDAVHERPEIRESPDFDEQRVRRLVRIFLDKVYFECRNLGAAPADRALNFAATNAFQVASGIGQGLLSGEIVPGAANNLYTLDSINVVRSPYCRMGSDCFDVLIKWFDPENERRAKSIFQFTVDVIDVLPVSLAPAHQYLAT